MDAPTIEMFMFRGLLESLDLDEAVVTVTGDLNIRGWCAYLSQQDYMLHRVASIPQVGAAMSINHAP